VQQTSGKAWRIVARLRPMFHPAALHGGATAASRLPRMWRTVLSDSPRAGAWRYFSRFLPPESKRGSDGSLQRHLQILDLVRLRENDKVCVIVRPARRVRIARRQQDSLAWAACDGFRARARAARVTEYPSSRSISETSVATSSSSSTRSIEPASDSLRL